MSHPSLANLTMAQRSMRGRPLVTLFASLTGEWALKLFEHAVLGFLVDHLKETPVMLSTGEWIVGHPWQVSFLLFVRYVLWVIYRAYRISMVEQSPMPLASIEPKTSAVLPQPQVTATAHGGSGDAVAQSQSSGTQVNAVNSILNINSPPVPVTSPPTRTIPDPPQITCRGPFDRTFHIHSIAMIRRRAARVGNLRVNGQSVSFRNSGRSAHGVTVTLEYRSEAGISIIIDRGYWDDASIYHDINRGSTRHLIIAAPWQSECGVLEADRSGQEIARIEVLTLGRWILEIGFISDAFNATYYSLGTVADNGNSTWKEPVATQPPEWNYVED